MLTIQLTMPLLFYCKRHEKWVARRSQVAVRICRVFSTCGVCRNQGVMTVFEVPGPCGSMESDSESLSEPEMSYMNSVD